MVVHRFNDRIRDGLARIVGLNSIAKDPAFHRAVGQ
jgi:hypothetical protein